MTKPRTCIDCGKPFSLPRRRVCNACTLRKRSERQRALGRCTDCTAEATHGRKCARHAAAARVAAKKARLARKPHPCRGCGLDVVTPDAPHCRKCSVQAWHERRWDWAGSVSSHVIDPEWNQ